MAEQAKPEVKKPLIMTRVFWHDWMPGWLPICVTIVGAIWWAAGDYYSITRDVLELKEGQATQQGILDAIRKDQLRLMFRLQVPFDDDGKPGYFVTPSQPAHAKPEPHSKRENPFLITDKQPPQSAGDFDSVTRIQEGEKYDAQGR